MYGMLVDFVPLSLMVMGCGTSGTRVRESKLYRTEEEAIEVVKQHKEVNKRR